MGRPVRTSCGARRTSRRRRSSRRGGPDHPPEAHLGAGTRFPDHCNHGLSTKPKMPRITDGKGKTLQEKTIEPQQSQAVKKSLIVPRRRWSRAPKPVRDRGPPLTGATVAMKATMPLTRTAVVMKATTNDQSNSDNEANATNGANNSDDQGSTTNEESNSGDEANDISDASKSDDTRVLDKSMLSSGPSLVSAFSQCYSVGLRCLWTLCLERTCVPWSHVAQH